METTLTETPTAAENSSGRPQLWLCFLASGLIGLNDGGGGVLIISLMSHYNVDKATISFMFLASTFGYLCSAFSSGPLLERLGRRRFLMLGAVLFSLGAILQALAPPFLLFLVALFLIGGGVALVDAGINAYVASVPNNTARLNYLHAFYGGGALIGPIAVSTILAFGLGWNTTYLLWLGVALIVLAGFARLFDGSRPSSDHPGGGNVLAATIRMPLVWIASFFLLVYVGAEVSVGSWGYAFLTQERGGPEILSAWTISGYWLGLTAGRVVLAKLGERIGNRRAIELCLGGVVVGVLLVWFAPISAVAALGLLITGFSLGPIFPTTIAMLSEIVPGRILPSAIGFVASFGSVGAAIAPFAVGNLAEAIGLWTLLPFVIALTLAMVVLWVMLTRGSAQP